MMTRVYQGVYNPVVKHIVALGADRGYEENPARSSVSRSPTIGTAMGTDW